MNSGILLLNRIIFSTLLDTLTAVLNSIMPPITLWFLQGSRCIRTAWLLEELGLDYTLSFTDRVKQELPQDQIAPEDFKLCSGNPLGKFPTLQDGELTIYESGAISEYDKINRNTVVGIDNA